MNELNKNENQPKNSHNESKSKNIPIKPEGKHKIFITRSEQAEYFGYQPRKLQ